MAEFDRIDAEDYVEPTTKDVSEDMSERMQGIRKRYDRCVDAEGDLRQMALEDFRFAWVEGCQWDGNLATRRGNRPKYEFNKLGMAIKEVINSNRQNTPSIKVRANKESTRDLADIRQGLIRNIESMSNADTVYDWGALFAITSGFGAWRVSARYADDESFDQDLFIDWIENPLTSIWFGPSKKKDRRDAPYAFIESEVTWEEYRERWPKAEYSSFTSVAMQGCGKWYGDKSCRIAEYFYKTSETETIYQLSDGRVVRASEWDPLQKDAEQTNALAQAPPQPAQPGQSQQPLAPTVPQLMGMPIQPQAPVTILKKREVTREVVKSEIISGLEVLEGPFDWPGKFIPIVPVWGQFVNDEGKDYWKGMVRPSKDPQRLYNYNRSNSVEVMANQSRAPFLYTPKMVDGFKTQWENMAVDNAAGLPFNPDPLVPGGMPVRQPPPAFPGGMLQASEVDDGDIKATTGVYQATLGQPSNETSGKAINSRARQSSTATYDYQDEIAKAVQYTGEIIDDLIPYFYDTYRELRILGPDGAEKYVEVNKPVWNPDARQWEKVNDLSQGKYDITVTVGPSYSTQRMETLDAMLQMAQAGGPTAMLFQYGAIKNMDVPGMQEVEDALRRMLVNTHILEPDANDPPAPPPPPPPPNPKDVASAQKDQALSVKAQADAALAQAKTQRTQIETQQMTAAAPANVEKAHADAAAANANAVDVSSDAAWKQAWLEQHRQVLNGGALVNLDQQSIPYGQG